MRPFGWFGRMRVYWGFIIFAFTFVGVLAEQFHRLYATFFGSFAALVAESGRRPRAAAS